MNILLKSNVIRLVSPGVITRKFILALALAGVAASLHAQGIIASGQVSGVAAGAGSYNYTLTVSEGSGTTTPIASFWYAWIPGQFFLPSDPTSAAGPTGWTASIVANSIQFQSTSAGTDIAPGSFMTFSYSATFSPAQLAAAANSGESVAYAGTVDASSPSEQFTVQAVPEPATPVLLLAGFAASWLGMRRKGVFSSR